VATLVDGAGRRRRERARYVVGADGMHSRVRVALGIDADGPEQLEERLVIHFAPRSGSSSERTATPSTS
jgi:2-polyprenyl-6-methoxyphenol hydroxylase-like FAD-dependent oxidoreductase